MTYKQKVDKFREICYKQNEDPNHKKWQNKEEFESYFLKFGGRIKTDKKRRKGYLVCLVQKGRSQSKYYRSPLSHECRPDLVVEIPMEFATKVLVLGGFP